MIHIKKYVKPFGKNKEIGEDPEKLNYLLIYVQEEIKCT
jgi:hypothetical protein